MKIYLDANILYGFFKSSLKKERFIMPKKIEILKNASSKHTLFTSVLTKAEIMRSIKLDYEVEFDKLEQIWNSLAKLLKLKLIKTIGIEEDFAELVGKHKLSCKINNVIHLYICAKNDLTLLTGDKKLIKDGRNVYKKIITYQELQRKI